MCPLIASPMCSNRRPLVLDDILVLLVIFLVSAAFNDRSFSNWSYHFFTSLLVHLLMLG